MSKCKNLLLIIAVVVLACLGVYGVNDAWGLDTDLYTVTGQEVPPNVLIILDNSSSMVNEDQGFDYNPNKPNPPPAYDVPPPNGYAKEKVYIDSDGKGTWIVYKDTIDAIDCQTARKTLLEDGMYNGRLGPNCNKGGPLVTLRTGNYLNWQILSSTSNQPRLGLAKGILHSYINATDGIRFGIMTFNASGHGGKVTAECSDDKLGAFNALSDISTSNVVDWTPLAETLYEAMLYFKGGPSYYNPGTNYNSPTLVRCAKNYVILITDGAPTHDVTDDGSNGSNSPIPALVGDYGQLSYGDPLLLGSHYLDDVAKYAHKNDLRPDLTGLQNITTYTIGFNSNQLAIDSSLLQSTAEKGGGKYFYCHNSNTFDAALQYIIAEILANPTSFVAPTVPISQFNNIESENRMYLGMFEPTEKSFWKGNIKKFQIADKTLGAIKIGDVLDAKGDLAIDPETNSIYETATTYWATTEDGGDVKKGGVGQVLQGMSIRSIYTFMGSNTDLTDASNLFTSTNPHITPSTLGLGSEEAKNKLINYVYGSDSYDENGNGNTTEKRDWILGAFVHSRPLVLHYSGLSVIYAGANDGMLHAFDATSGEELWAFIPPDLLPNLQNLTGNTVQFFVDGSPKAYLGSDGKKIMVCGERRGGNHYFALDVTDPLAPKWLWEVHPGLSDYSEMGQSWSSPLIGKIKYGSGDKWVVFIGGGYDPNQDKLPVTKDDAMGRAVYVVDLLTGARIWKYSVGDNAQMKYSIPSDIARVDTNGDGYIDRLYVGDMGGQMWRFDIKDPNPSNWSGKRIFESNIPAPSSGVDRRKIFYAPDVSLDKDGFGSYELVLFGTGDREHPKNTHVVDRLYTVKDRNPGSALNESNLVDVTLDLLQNPSTSAPEKQAILNSLKSGSGWYIRLDQSKDKNGSLIAGEKCLAPPLIFYGVSYFSTFAPLQDSSDPCILGGGTARLYALNYLNGNAIFNFDSGNDDGDTPVLGKTDQSMLIGTAIPSGAIIAIIGGSTSAGYIGVGGGIFRAPLKSPNVIIPLTWRQKF